MARLLPALLLGAFILAAFALATGSAATSLHCAGANFAESQPAATDFVRAE